MTDGKSLRDVPLAEAYARLDALEGLARAAEHLRPGPWHAVYEQNEPPYDDVDPARDAVWTVSHRPGVPGWRTDGGCPGYGLPKPVADLMSALDPASVRSLISLARRGLGGQPGVDFEQDEVVSDDGEIVRVRVVHDFLADQGYRQPDLARMRFLLASAVDVALAEHADDRAAAVAAVLKAVETLPFGLDEKGRRLVVEWAAGRLDDAAFLAAVMHPARDVDRSNDHNGGGDGDSH